MYILNDDGSADLGGRVVPVPTTISPEAQRSIRDAAGRPQSPTASIMSRRAEIDAQMALLNDVARSRYATDITEATIGGVHCQIVRRAGSERDGTVFLNLHAGGFVTGSGSLVEAIPIAALTGSTVIAVDYRLAPEHSFPAPVDDVVAVYREVLGHHAPTDIGIFGTSAGAFLTAQTILRLQHEGLPLPACAGMFTGGGDVTNLGDSAAIFNMSGFAGERLIPYGQDDSEVSAFLGDADPTDPLVAPLHGDLKSFPPTLLLTSSRDPLLSATSLMHRALRRAGVAAELYVFEALSHGFWYNLGLPETQEALDIMATFLRSHLGAHTTANVS